MWYNRSKGFLLNKGYSNSDDCPCVFIRRYSTGFCIILVYADDLNIIDHTKDINEALNHINTKFKINDFRRTKFCLGLQLEYLQTGILIDQSAYVQKILEKFNMDKVYLVKTLMVVRALVIDIDSFRLKEEGEELLGLE
jgi:hypothetical protein